MAKRGRPKKKADDLNEEKFEEQSENNETIDETPQAEQSEEVVEEQPKEAPQSDSNIIGEGTFSDYNPLAESVIERDYSTPKVASGVVEDIDEPHFVPPSYEDIVNDSGEEVVEEETGSPFDNPNPALNELDNKDKKIACESLVDTFLDGYEQLHRYAQYVVKVDEDELLQLHQADKIDLNERIPVDENGNEMSVSEFVAQYNEQGVEALQYNKEFGYKVRPAMVRVFMKKGWGMSDEQFLIYHFGKDIAIKLGIMYQLKKTINTTLETLQKAHKRNKGMGVSSAESSFAQQEEEIEPDFDDEEEFDNEPEAEIIADETITPLTPEQDFEDKTESYNKGLNINMPDKKKPTILPKEVRDEIQKPKKSKKKKKNDDE